MSIDLETLGFTKAELQERVVERICEQLLTSVGMDEDGDEVAYASTFKREIDKRIKAQVEASINAIAEREVLPNVASYIEELVLQQTNEWGEKRGTAVTFREYLVQRAKAYMLEEVDSQGKSRAEMGGSSFYGTKQTRITFLVHQHLGSEVSAAMKDAMKVGMGEVARGIHETARLKLNEIAAQLKVEVKA